MSTFTGEQHEKLVSALELIQTEFKSSLQDLPDSRTHIAVGLSESSSLSDIRTAKSWLRKAESEPVRWAAVTDEVWSILNWILETPADEGYASVNVDTDAVYFGARIAHGLSQDLGGSNYGHPPFVAMFSNETSRRYESEDRVWVSRSREALVEVALNDPRIEEMKDKSWRDKYEPAFWFTTVSPNLMYLLMNQVKPRVVATTRQPSRRRAGPTSEQSA